MKQETHVKYWRTLLVVAVAIAMGYISGHLLFLNGSALNIFPWGVLVVASASIAATKREAIKFGAVSGFVVSFSFLWFNNTDHITLSQALKLTAAAGIAASFGLLCGVALGWLSWKARQIYHKKWSK